MTLLTNTIVGLLLLFRGTADDTWVARLENAQAQVARNPSVAAYSKALDAAFRADDWRAGETLALAAREKHPSAAELHGLTARAMWRAGQIAQAEAAAAQIPDSTRDAVALNTRLGIAIASCDWPAAEAAAGALAALPDLTAPDYAALIGASFLTQRLDGLDGLIRKALAKADPANGYPEGFLEEHLSGLPEFLQAVGPAPLNQIQQMGEAPMPNSNLNLPMCEAYLNDRGPYRFIVDTGGSVMLSLDREVAEEVGLPKYATAIVRGVTGADESTQTLVDELKIGGIGMKRVMARAFDARKALAYSADGIVGTGVFSEGRLTLDFREGVMRLAPSTRDAGPGVNVPIRVIGDSKLMALVNIHDRPGVALLDSGADAIAVSPARLREWFPDASFLTVDTGAFGVGTGEDPGIAVGPAVKLEFAGRTWSQIGGIGLNVLDETLSPMLGMQTDILIGMPVFRETATVTVDFPTGRLWLEWLDGAAAR